MNACREHKLHILVEEFTKDSKIIGGECPLESNRGKALFKKIRASPESITKKAIQNKAQLARSGSQCKVKLVCLPIFL